MQIKHNLKLGTHPSTIILDYFLLKNPFDFLILFNGVDGRAQRKEAEGGKGRQKSITFFGTFVFYTNTNKGTSTTVF